MVARQSCRALPLPAQLPDGGVPDGGVPDGISPDGGVPDGFSPDGAVPFIPIPPSWEGRVPFISIPAGGVPEGAVPFCISAGGVPDGAVLADELAALSAGADADCSTGAAVEDAADCVEEVPESDVQPATQMPAIRIAEATSMMMILLFMGYVSCMHGRDLDPAGPGSGCRKDHASGHILPLFRGAVQDRSVIPPG